MEAKLIAALIVIIAFMAVVGWAETEKSARNKLQAEYTQYKLDAADELAKQVAQNVKDREAADVNNVGVINDLNSQIQSARSLNAGISAQLHDYQVRAGAATLPKAGHNPSTPGSTTVPSYERLDAALTAAILECNINRDNQAALIRELTPQL